MTVVEVRAARERLQRFAIERASNAELAVISDQLGTDLALLQGDLEAQDFSLLDEQILRNGIAYLECQLAEVIRQTERRLRARRAVQYGINDNRADFQARFDAMHCADIVDAIQTLGTPLGKRGQEWWGHCPFHEERTPSFAVSMEKGVWRCHGCQRGGDLVSFVMQQRHLNAVEALRFLEEIVTVPGVAA